MIILIAGCSHTGKTALAQRLLQKYQMPYLSIDHLKMGMIRSGALKLSPMDSQEIETSLWPILREMIKTAIENRQNLIVEGCYIPFDWARSFEEDYRKEIRYICLVMSEAYIRTHFQDILSYANVVETRLDDSGLTMEELIQENEANLKNCLKYGCAYRLIDGEYPRDLWL